MGSTLDPLFFNFPQAVLLIVLFFFFPHSCFLKNFNDLKKSVLESLVELLSCVDLKMALELHDWFRS